MDAALEALVVKSGTWTVDEMSNELMYLNKLAYPFRQQYDRTQLMQVRWIAHRLPFSFYVWAHLTLSFCLLQLTEEHIESLK